MRHLWPIALILSLAACGGSDEEESNETEGAQAAEPVEPPEELVEGETGVRELKDGLVVDTTVGGRGIAAQNGDLLRIHYEGRVAESGEVFASTRTTGIPYAFTLGEKGVIQAWELALRGSRPGSEHHLDVPSSLAYADKGFGSVPADAELEFDIRVVSVERK